MELLYGITIESRLMVGIIIVMRENDLVSEYRFSCCDLVPDHHQQIGRKPQTGFGWLIWMAADARKIVSNFI